MNRRRTLERSVGTSLLKKWLNGEQGESLFLMAVYVLGSNFFLSFYHEKIT